MQKGLCNRVGGCNEIYKNLKSLETLPLSQFLNVKYKFFNYKNSFIQIANFFVCIDITGLGGAVDGYSVEHAYIGATATTLQHQIIINAADTGLSLPYIKVFQPNALVKMWFR